MHSTGPISQRHLNDRSAFVCVLILWWLSTGTLYWFDDQCCRGFSQDVSKFNRQHELQSSRLHSWPFRLWFTFINLYLARRHDWSNVLDNLNSFPAHLWNAFKREGVNASYAEVKPRLAILNN